MYRVLSASQDTYITNKIIRNSFRATDANTGQAGTLDLFKLYGESVSGSADNPVEISRALVKFDLTPLSTMLTNGDIDINNSSFSATLVLRDVYGGQTTPNNFKMIALPLAQQFQEGIGRDVVTFQDLGSSNFITASYENGTYNSWNTQGAMKSGSLGDGSIDVIVSGSLEGPSGTQTLNLSSEQYFSTGKEDFSVDVTNAISGTVSGQISNHGFLIAYSGSYENDTKTYFVKRFASRNSSREDLRPKIIIKYNDAIIDNHENFIFDVTGSIFLNNYHRGTLSNILSGAGSQSTQITGHNCLKVRLESGSFTKTVTASQYSIGDNFQAGIYSASFVVSRYDASLIEHLKSSTSASFDAIWSSGTDLFPDYNSSVAYHSGSLVIKTPSRTAFNGGQKRLLLTMENLRPNYRKDDLVKLRVFIEDRDRQINFKKKPFATKSQVYESMFYQVKDAQTDRIIIPFDSTGNSTKLSSDSEGMYFNFYLDSLPAGKTYKFEFLIKDFNSDYFIKDVSAKFSVDLD